ncbi:FixH family protein [Mesorhizobium australicum]|uniref:YtkA-like n=1 Tax=Mesorhizobium australicum TaxID=536018 RepID=A0A1X7MNA1_9HYPH|nr:FixH family protein [Mesorhizobium australicum]SMH26165.1 YtkA-like [Mesorhizobium australicum]
MISNFFLRTAPLALAFILAAPAARAASQDYEFELVENEVKAGDQVIVAVKLFDKGTGAPVENAVIFAIRMDMAPDGMEAMTTSVEAMPSDQPGVYRFKTNLMMAGGWQLSLAAKVQGEAETVQSKLVLKAVQ